MESQSINILLLPSLHAAESLRSYMLRTARANAFSKMYMRDTKIFDSAAGFTELIARRSPELRKKLGHRVAPPLATGKISASLMLGEEWIPSKYVFIERRRVCPVCLELYGFARCDWELKSITACARHKVELASQCPSCHRPLNWSSTELLQCSCGQPLSAIKVNPATDHDVAWAKQIQLAVTYSIHGKSAPQGFIIPIRMRLSQLLLMADVVKNLILAKHSKHDVCAQKRKQLVAQVLTDDNFRLHLWESMFLHAAADPFTFATKLRLGQNLGELARNYSGLVSELVTPRAFMHQGQMKPVTRTKRVQRWQKHVLRLKTFYRGRLTAGGDPFDPAFARRAGRLL